MIQIESYKVISHFWNIENINPSTNKDLQKISPNILKPYTIVHTIYCCSLNHKL